MSDTAYPVFQHYGTNAERLAFTPSPASGTQPIYIWYETDTNNYYIYTTTWQGPFSTGGGGTVTHTGALTANQLVVGNGTADIKVSDLTGDVTTSGGVATTLANTAVTPGSYTNTDLTVDAKGRITAAANGSGGSGGGLWNQVLSSTPTAAATGLSNYLGTGATSTDGATGQIISGTAGGMAAYTTSVPATPYTITALLAATDASAVAVPGIGWTDGTKIQFMYAAKSSEKVLVQHNSDITTYVATDFSSAVWAANIPTPWFQITDDGTNVTFKFSCDGVTFVTAYTVAKSSGYLGSSGYSHLLVGSPGLTSGVFYVTVLSWTQT